MARYTATGRSAVGALTTPTNLFVVQSYYVSTPDFRISVPKVVFGVEGASSYAQGQLEVSLYSITSFANLGSPSASVTPNPQDSLAPTWSTLVGTATNTTVSTSWGSAPTPGNQLTRRSFSVLSESQWNLTKDNPGAGNSGVYGLLFCTAGNASPLAAGLQVSWTVFLDIDDNPYA